MFDPKFNLNGKARRPVVAGGPAGRRHGAIPEEGLSADGLHGVRDVVVEELAPLHRHVRQRSIRAHLHLNEEGSVFSGLKRFLGRNSKYIP